MFKPFIAGVGAIGIAASTIVSFAPTVVAQQGCTPVHIVSVPGAGGTTSDSSNEVNSGLEGAIVKKVQQARPDDVSIWQPAYPSSAGAAWSAAIPHPEGNTFGRSRLMGDQQILTHLEGYISNCSDSKIAVVGFSEGAAVAGDVLSLLANGAVEGLGDDNILGGILFADPGRSGGSQFTGPAEDSEAYIEHPAGLEYQRNGEYSTPTAEGSVGWVGQRSLDYGAIGQRVISICNDADVACSVPIGSPLRDIADLSDKDLDGNTAYESKTGLSQVFENGGFISLAIGSVTDGFLGKILAGDISGALDSLEKSAVESTTMDVNEIGMVVNLVNEIREVVSILKTEGAYGSSVTERQIMGHLIKEIYPSLSGALPQNIEQIAGPILDGYADADPLPADVAERVNPLVQKIKDFSTAHGVYFVDSEFTVNGQRASLWASDALIAAVDRAISGETITIPAGESPRSGEEIAEENRKDDGLRALLETGMIPEVGSLDVVVDPTTSPSPVAPVDVSTTEENSIVNTESETESTTEENENSSKGESDYEVIADVVDTPYSTSVPVDDILYPEMSNYTGAFPVSKQYGPDVATGGTVKISWIDRLVSIVR